MKLARTIHTRALKPIEALPLPSRMPTSFPQQRFWLTLRMARGGEAPNLQMRFRVRGGLGKAPLQSPLYGLAIRHELPRTISGAEDCEPFQIGLADVGLPQKRSSRAAEADLGVTLADLIRNEAHATFGLDAEPLIRGRLVRIVEGDHILPITMHHEVLDEWLPKILTREFSELYAVAQHGRANRLASLPVQYVDDSVWQRIWRANEVLKLQSGNWPQILAEAPVMGPTQWDYSGTYAAFVLHETLTRQLKALSRRHRTISFGILLAGWALVMARVPCQGELIISTPIASRVLSEDQGLIRCFANILGLQIDLSANLTLEKLLERINAPALWAQTMRKPVYPPRILGEPVVLHEVALDFADVGRPWLPTLAREQHLLGSNSTESAWTKDPGAHKLSEEGSPNGIQRRSRVSRRTRARTIASRPPRQHLTCSNHDPAIQTCGPAL
ncbi:hypothetical protein EOA32_05650 [Mesorhizobium sp. M1A.F.Ca.ET.072.01.1.1]|uniref:condensation domain-containing protein n=1 Tax=Mesorhizobium sp. M1A.F.Ca.ET.072.01.1.1 TaxID=2496753 RepID=UPI000FD4A4FC|nr:condensation domain-containing protein [Mesorhizobium sp. M1A.F.Ca.ET.072.01.1.1]RUW54426.1 hypothetical protein EOA32_05650 [Mesorhizobium sp. M1A.F.Ca.ET.072.01.1.1]TIV04815.1 MAG: hypothetical protein E5W04_01705 [Mesorhizobium sp.]